MKLKKLIGIIYSLFIVTCLIISCLLYHIAIDIKAKADTSILMGGSGSATSFIEVSESYVYENAEQNFMTYYFTNLRNNLGHNPANYCVFVALAMQFSYYDTWWNDDIIPENYESCVSLGNNKIKLENIM